ncbi:pol polyprotein [Tanacetum coccineum]
MFTGNGTVSKIKGKRKVILKLTSGKDLVHSNLLHVLNITKNMISGPILSNKIDRSCTVFAQSVNEPVRHKSEEHPLDTCNSSLGHCSRECQTKCCNQNCGIRYYGGKGYCVDIPRGGSLCQCHYPC